MTPFKLFSTGLIAVAMLTTSAMAHESPAGDRYFAWKHHASAAPADSHARMPAPFAAESNLSSGDQPGGVCDHGDDPQIC
jgi:hypothetical protein